MTWPGDDPATHPFKAAFTIAFVLACCAVGAAIVWAKPGIALRLLGTAPALTILGVIAYDLFAARAGR